MVRMIYCVMSREDISLQDFREFFNGDHKLLMSVAARELGAVDYKQSLTLQVDRNFTIMYRRGTELPYDGIIEMWWENAAKLEGIMESEEILIQAEEIFSEASQYIDLSRSRIFFTEQPISF